MKSPGLIVWAVSATVALGALAIVDVIQPGPVYQISSDSIDAIPANAMVDFGKISVTRIWAWTNRGGANVDFDNLNCLHGVTGNFENSLLAVGDVVHIKARIFGDMKLTRVTLLDCRIVQDKAP